MSRDKGARGEREIVSFARKFGISAVRTAPLQAAGAEYGDVLFDDYRYLHIEVKRDERMSVDAMARQAKGDAGLRRPVVLWRRNKGDWYANVPLEHYLQLLKGSG